MSAKSGPAGGATTSAADMAEAARIRKGGGDGASHGKKLPAAVDLDENAVQKYVLVKALLDPPVYFVRGSETAAYHKDAAYPLLRELKDIEVPYEVLGGGRIKHSSKEKKIKVYGYSYGFPWEGGVFKHHITADILKVRYPDYEIETSNEGY